MTPSVVPPATAQFVRRENIERLLGQIAECTDEKRLSTLRCLLEAEMDGHFEPEPPASQ